MPITIAQLVDRFDSIYRDRMQDLPIVNANLEVEAVSFDRWEDQNLGVLVTPWFINLVLLPTSDEYDGIPQGKLIQCTFPSGPCELTVCHDDVLGTYLAAVLFRTVEDFPDQGTARAIAEEALLRILEDPEAPTFKRRDFFTGLGKR